MTAIQQIQSQEIQGKIFAYAFQLTQDNEKARELRQEVMFYAIRKIHLYNEEGKLIHWLRTITRNTFINQYRKERNKKTLELYGNYPYAERNAGEYSEEVAEIWRKIEALPKRYKSVIGMLIEGAKYEEIAEAENICLGTVKSSVFHARRKLADSLGIKIGKQ